MDCSAIVLSKLLKERNLDLWARLKLVFLDAAFSNLYSAISKYYDLYGNIPSFDELELTLREGPAQKTLATLKLVDDEDISSEVALNALIDQYTQNETIKLLDKFVDKLPVYDTQEIKENLSSIVLTLDEKTITTEGVYNMADIMLFQSEEEIKRERMHLGLNNTFDATLGGVARQELIMVGGKRGSGKSIVCSNVMVNQYNAGKTSVYFTIEMVAHETLQRNISIGAGVPHAKLKQNTLSDEELLRVIKFRAGMFENADDLVRDYLDHKDKMKFESRLVREKKLKQDNQMIIIDDRALTLTSLDLHLGKLKAKFGDSLGVCVVDYLNQIVIEGQNKFDWQPQITVATKLKEFARKYDVVMFSPYQIDATGEARFAKGILDPADVALILSTEEDSITMSTTKIRGGPQITCTSGINWETLGIDPTPRDAPAEKSDGEHKTTKIKRVSKKKEDARVDDTSADIPWN